MSQYLYFKHANDLDSRAFAFEPTLGGIFVFFFFKFTDCDNSLMVRCSKRSGVVLRLRFLVTFIVLGVELTGSISARNCFAASSHSRFSSSVISRGFFGGCILKQCTTSSTQPCLSYCHTSQRILPYSSRTYYTPTSLCNSRRPTVYRMFLTRNANCLSTNFRVYVARRYDAPPWKIHF